MKLTTLFGSIGLSCVLASSANAQWWLDDFDSYLLGPLASQSLWDEWSGSTGVDANVDNTYSFSTKHSLMIVTGNDVVWDFVNSPGGRPTSGLWSLSIKTYVPTGATGKGWYILLNEYPTPLKYSVQTQFDASHGIVADATGSCPLKYDRWVSLVISIDLDNNLYSSWYGSTPLVVNRPWASSTGQTTLAVNDCYGDSGGCSGVWFDDDRLDKCSGGPLVLTTKPNPIAAGQTLNFYSQSPSLASGDLGMLFLWSVNGSLFPLGLVPASYGAAGDWTFGAVVPTGLAGLELGFRMFAAPAGGKVMLSNEDIVEMK
jgi:hypothetical protein